MNEGCEKNKENIRENTTDLSIQLYYTLTSRKKQEEKNRVKDLDPEKYRENTTDFIQVAGLH